MKRWVGLSVNVGLVVEAEVDTGIAAKVVGSYDELIGERGLDGAGVTCWRSGATVGEMDGVRSFRLVG